jgi:hypothetical protein
MSSTVPMSLEGALNMITYLPDKGGRGDEVAGLCTHSQIIDIG